MTCPVGIVAIYAWLNWSAPDWVSCCAVTQLCLTLLMQVLLLNKLNKEFRRIKSKMLFRSVSVGVFACTAIHFDRAPALWALTAFHGKHKLGILTHVTLTDLWPHKMNLLGWGQLCSLSVFSFRHLSHFPSTVFHDINSPPLSAFSLQP